MHPHELATDNRQVFLLLFLLDAAGRAALVGGGERFSGFPLGLVGGRWGDELLICGL